MLKSSLPRISAGLKPKSKIALKAAAEEIARDARSRVPVSTGKLRDSIEAKPDGDSWRVEAGEFYGIFVEFGTSKTPARPFLVPATEQARRKILAGFKKIV